MAENKTETKSKKGREEYSSDKLWARREKRTAQAEERDAKHQSLTLQQRLEKAQGRRGESKREVGRITKLLAVQKTPAVKPQPLTEEQKPIAVPPKPKKNYQKPKRS
jgi:hypothetical protein